MSELRDLVVATLQDVRRLAVELRPAALDDFGLVPALERLRDTVSEQRRSLGRRAIQPGRRAPARRDRDRALPHRPGGSDQRAEARGRESCHGSAEQERDGRGSRRAGRREGVRAGRRAGRRPRADRDARARGTPRRSPDRRVERRGGNDVDGARFRSRDPRARSSTTTPSSGPVSVASWMRSRTSRPSARLRMPTAPCSRRSTVAPTSC